jgi:hypothetical protein
MNAHRLSLFIHQKNPISFSYDRSTFVREKFDRFLKVRRQPEHCEFKNWNRNFIREAYLLNPKEVFTYINGRHFEKIFLQNEEMYHFLMKNLKMTFVNPVEKASNGVVSCVRENVNFVSSTSELNLLEEQTKDYYQLFIKGFEYPLYFSSSTKLYDNDGNQKKLLDILYRTERKRILGLCKQHMLKDYEIVRFRNLNSEEDDLDILDSPFYEFCVSKEHDEHRTLLVDHILVDLD